MPPQLRPSYIWRQLALDFAGRVKTLTAHTRNVPTADDVDLAGIASITPGLTGPDLRKLIKESRCRAADRGDDAVQMADFCDSLEAIASACQKRIVWSEEELALAARREAGCALLGMLVPGADRFRRASLFAGARVREVSNEGPEHSRGRIVSLLGGAAAEQIEYGHVVLDEHPATAYATPLARQLIASQGIADWTTPAQVIEDCYRLAVMTLEANRRELDALTQALREHETLEESRVRELTEIPDQVVVRPRFRLHRPRHVVPKGRMRTGAVRRSATPAAGASLVALAAGAALGSGSLPLRLPPLRLGGGREASRDLVPPTRSRHRSVGLMSRVDRARYWGLALVWAAVTTSFWAWWLSHAAHSTPALYWLQTTALCYQTCVLPSFYWFFVGKMRRPVEVPAPADMRVAMITLCVPSEESMGVIAEQLAALQDVTYPHDSWILDEGDSDEVRALAERHGVKYFTRHGIAGWNQSKPPFQVSTKAGNVNAWLDHVGLDYDVFVQLDIDHRPRVDYLERVLGYFADHKVGWIQAPSVCGNLDSWTARGLAEQDLVFQGPLQMGFYGHTGTPFIIGSHTTYRTAAIREIGGYQPTRAEDHLDTVVLAAHGYTGVFVPELIATGDGPHDLATYLRQQFAWAYSMIQIFCSYTPRLLRRYSPGQAFQFLVCQSWYTLWSLSLALLWALPSVALVIHKPVARVSPVAFLLYFVPMILTSSLMWCASRKWFQPNTVKLSWRGVILEIARWPVVLWALINVVLRIRRPYMITPKGVAAGAEPARLSIYLPYLTLAIVPLAAIWVFEATSGGGGVQGYYGLALVNAAIGLIVVATILMMEIRHIAPITGAFAAVRARASMVASVAVVLALLVFSAVTVWEPMTRVLS